MTTAGYWPSETAFSKTWLSAPYLLDTLDIWDQHLVRLSATITRTRYTYLEKLKQLGGEVYNGYFPEKRNSACGTCPKPAQILPTSLPLAGRGYRAEAVRKARREDLKAGSTTSGGPPGRPGNLHQWDERPHLRLPVGSSEAPYWPSSCPECGMIRQLTGEEPVVPPGRCDERAGREPEGIPAQPHGRPADLHHLLRPLTTSATRKMGKAFIYRGHL